MLKKYLPIILFIFLPACCMPQEKQLIDSDGGKIIEELRQRLIVATNDSGRLSIMESLGFYYEVLNADSSVKYTQLALAYARKHGYLKAEARLMAGLSSAVRQQGKFAEALDLLFKSLKLAQENNFTYDIARAYRRLGLVYSDMENFPKAVAYLLQAAAIDEKSLNGSSAAIDHVLVGEAYEKINKLDSAAFHINTAFKQKDAFDLLAPDIYNINGSIQAKKGNYGQALSLYTEGISLAKKNNDLVVSSKIYAGLSIVFTKINKRDSAIFYAQKSFENAQQVSFKKGIILSGNLLSDLYGSSQPVEALRYYKIAASTKDSLFGVNNIQTIQDLVAREEGRQKELDDARISYHNRLKLYGLGTGIIVLLVIAFLLYRNNRHKQKANVLLYKQKETIEATLNELKSTQTLLIQSEKMASLGALTAGIAHEIQNPLNFVNNFSEVNKEMLEELKAERLKPKAERDEHTEDEIIGDVIANEEKINHHGKRADAIVKGMLQHSQSSSGKKEPTDINALCDEYLRLSYHGLRAKDKSFNATLKTAFDPSLGKINIISQDIGRVLMNLLTNAFYAVNEKKNSGIENYEPTISISTKKINDKVLISVSDNGNGIPKNIVDKIFQPFFTTKPTGQGTGLGLSLSYDIVKAHGGEITVNSKDGEDLPDSNRAGQAGSTFIIKLPNA